MRAKKSKQPEPYVSDVPNTPPWREEGALTPQEFQDQLDTTVLFCLHDNKGSAADYYRWRVPHGWVVVKHTDAKATVSPHEHADGEPHERFPHRLDLRGHPTWVDITWRTDKMFVFSHPHNSTACGGLAVTPDDALNAVEWQRNVAAMKAKQHTITQPETCASDGDAPNVEQALQLLLTAVNAELSALNAKARSLNLEDLREAIHMATQGTPLHEWSEFRDNVHWCYRVVYVWNDAGTGWEMQAQYRQQDAKPDAWSYLPACTLVCEELVRLHQNELSAKVMQS